MSTISKEPTPATAPKSDTAQKTPIRAGVFTHVADADKAVHGLQAAGFTDKEITVVCSNEARESHFRQFEHQDPAGAHTPNAALTGGAIGAVLGGIAGLSGIVATGGLGLVATGFILAAGAGQTGTFVGAMMTRGIERSLADFYDQSVVHGDLLVAVEAHGPGREEKLRMAECILRDAGAKAAPLPAG